MSRLNAWMLGDPDRIETEFLGGDGQPETPVEDIE